MGIPWKTCANSYNINDLIKLNKAPTYEIQDFEDAYNELLANAPQLQVREGYGYSTYFWVKNGWKDDGADGIFVEGWCNENGEYAGPDVELEEKDGTLTPGVGAWFYNPYDDGTTIPMLSGAVETADYELDCPIDFSIRSLTVPQSVNINDASKILFSGVDATYEIPDEDWEDPLANLLAGAPQIQVQRLNESAYNMYFYVKNAFVDDGADGQFVEGWCNEYGMLADPKVNADLEENMDGEIFAGSAFWTKGVKSAFKIKFFGLK